jgi:hypothetical protein
MNVRCAVEMNVQLIFFWKRNDSVGRPIAWFCTNYTLRALDVSPSVSLSLPSFCAMASAEK